MQVLLGLPLQHGLVDVTDAPLGDIVREKDDGVAPASEIGLEEGVVQPVAGETFEVPEQDTVRRVGGAAFGVGCPLSAVMDEVVKGVAADDGPARFGFVGKDAHQDQVVPLAVLLGDAALLVHRAFLLVTARITKVADDAGTGWERTCVGHDITCGS